MCVCASMADGRALAQASLLVVNQGDADVSVVDPVAAAVKLAEAIVAKSIEIMKRTFPQCPFERFADDSIVHCRSESRLLRLKKHWKTGSQRAGWKCTKRKQR